MATLPATPHSKTLGVAVASLKTIYKNMYTGPARAHRRSPHTQNPHTASHSTHMLVTTKARPGPQPRLRPHKSYDTLKTPQNSQTPWETQMLPKRNRPGSHQLTISNYKLTPSDSHQGNYFRLMFAEICTTAQLNKTQIDSALINSIQLYPSISTSKIEQPSSPLSMPTSRSENVRRAFYAKQARP